MPPTTSGLPLALGLEDLNRTLKWNQWLLVVDHGVCHSQRQRLVERGYPGAGVRADDEHAMVSSGLERACIATGNVNTGLSGPCTERDARVYLPSR